MDRELFGGFDADPSRPLFEPEHRGEGEVHRTLRCPCGSEVFRLTGWPRIVSGAGGFFWRSMTRVWREARMANQVDGEPLESPFWLPIFACCPKCAREEALLDHESVFGRMDPGDRAAPREAVRCRICARGRFELVAGMTFVAGFESPAIFDLTARCHACHRQARIAWSLDPGTDRERRLDLLYGRR